MRSQGFRRLHELLINRHRKATHGVTTALTKLVWWIADDHVELHIASKYLAQSRLHVVGMDKRISMCFKSFTTVVVASISTAKSALLTFPRVFYSLEPYIPSSTFKAIGNRVPAVGVLRAVDAAPRQQAG
jgi:hypothetical protein